ncbi:MAG: PAS domain S-box protein [Ignavibacteriaceae bacterium]|jgi:PAS domain S-box-containing protein
MFRTLNDLLQFFNSKWNDLISVNNKARVDAHYGSLFIVLMVISTGIVLLLTIVFLSMIPLGLVDASVVYVAAAFPFVFIPISVYCIIQAKHGKVRSSVTLYVWINMAAISAAVFIFEGVLSPAWVLYIWTITIAGTLLTPIYALWMTGGVVIYFFFLLILTKLGFYKPLLTFGMGHDFVETSSLLIMLVSTVGLLTYLNMRSLRKTLGDLNKEIAERQRAEGALQLSEEKYRMVANFTYDWEAWRAPNGTYRYISPSCERITGHKVEEFLSDQELTIKITHPDDRHKLIEHQYTGSHEAQGKGLEFDFRIIRPNGETRWINHSCIAVYGSGGEWLGRRLSNRDITERKQVEEAMRDSEERYRSLSEAAQDFIFIVNPEGTFQYINSFGASQIGKRAEEIVGVNWKDILGSVPSKEELAAINRVFTDGITTHFESQIVFSQRKIWFSIKFVPLRNSFGEISSLMGIARDITERKQLEEAMRDSEERQGLILRSLPVAIYTAPVEPEVDAFWISGNVFELTGYSTDEFITEPDFWRRRLHPEDRSRVLEAFERAAVLGEVNIEYRWQVKNGQYKWFLDRSVRHEVDKKQEYFGVLIDITERKQAEESLKSSEEKFNKAFQSSPVAMSMQNAENIFVNVNDAFLKLTGYSREEIIGHSGKELRLWVDENEGIRVNDHFRVHGSLHDIEFKFRRKSGEIGVGIISAESILLEGKTADLSAVLDITERKRAEGALRQAEEKYRSIFENAVVGIYQTKTNGQYVSANPTLALILGYASLLELMASVTDINHQFYVEPNRREEFIRLVEEQGSVLGFESRVYRKDGSVIWVSEAGRSIRDADGDPFGFEGITIDITDRKQAEEHIVALALRYQTLLQTASDGIHILDTQGNILEANDAFCNMLGYTREELLKLNVADWDMQWSREKLLEDMNEFIYHPTIFETKHRRKDGTIIDVEINNVSVTLEGQNYLYAASRNITERKRTEEEIKLKNEQLIKLNSEKDKFFSIIAHDLRSPFQGFIALTELLTEDVAGFTESERTILLKKMHGSAVNLYKLLMNLLDWANVQKGTINFSPAEIMLFEYVNQTIDLLTNISDQKAINVCVDVSKELKVFADDAMFNSILRNILSNALKFTPKGGNVTLTAKSIVEGMVEVSIADSGIGMTEILLKKLFKIGEKVGRKGTEDEESTGLGLLLCKEFVEKHGGKIWVESEEGKGSTFNFILPENENVFTSNPVS